MAHRLPLKVFQITIAPKQKSFMASTHKRRLFRAANQVGKSDAGAHESVCHAMGAHPYKQLSGKPTRGLIVCPDWRSYVDVVSKKMYQCLPTHWIHPSSRYTPERGWVNKMIRLVNGSEILFRVCGQDATSIAGTTIDWCWIDEPPERAVYSEISARLAVSNGPLWLTCTPVGTAVQWLRDMVEQGDWHQTVMTATPEDCPHRTLESLEAQRDNCLPHEIPQRIYGEWDGIETDRVYYQFTDDHILSDGHPLLVSQTGDTPRYALGIDYGQEVGRQVAILLGVIPRKHMIVFDEYVSDTQSDYGDDAKSIKDMLDRQGLEPSDISLAIGDINSAGKDYAGKSMNKVLGDLLGIHIASANKQKVTRHIADTSILFQSDKLFVHNDCTNMIKSLNGWADNTKTEHLKHCIDALHYIAQPAHDRWLKAPPLQVTTTGRVIKR